MNSEDQHHLLDIFNFKHINSYDNVFLKGYFLLVTYGVFSPVAKIERSIIKLIFQNFLIEGKVNVSYYYGHKL